MPTFQWWRMGANDESNVSTKIAEGPKLQTVICVAAKSCDTNRYTCMLMSSMPSHVKKRGNRVKRNCTRKFSGASWYKHAHFDNHAISRRQDNSGVYGSLCVRVTPL